MAAMTHEHLTPKNINRTITISMETLCIDAGNTLVKVACVENGAVRRLTTFGISETDRMLQHIAALPKVEACILSSVSVTEIAESVSAYANFFVELSSQTPIPIHNKYSTPSTLGNDRLAAVVGAHCRYPAKDILVVDAGTALTIDFIDRTGNYWGGNISPGVQMRFQALHHYTRQLPLEGLSADFDLIGNSTSSAIISGVQNSIIFEIDGYMKHLATQYPDVIMVLTGGDANFFADKFENSTFAEPNLVFVGLEEIIKFNL